MRLARLTEAVIAISLVAVAAVPVTATAAPGSGPDDRPDNPVLTGKAPAAERALEAVEAAFERSEGGTPRPGAVGHRGGELTQQLLQLRLGFDDLSAEDRRTARQYLARPTDGSEYYGANYAKDARPTNDCRTEFRTVGSEVCVHWARRTVDAPPAADADGDGMPNQVERTRDTLNSVWSRIVGAGGYKAPLKDRKGPDSKLDIYLVDIGGDGLYGYCGAEDVDQGRWEAAYCVLDDDYAKAQFPSNTPLGNLRVTSAHEFFHAVQFAYDVREDPWLMESTATWIEDEIYDGVNDNLYYLRQSSLTSPQRPLDSAGGLFLYGNWIWWRYLTERFPEGGAGDGLPALVRRVWERADAKVSETTYSMDALDRVLAADGEGLARVFAEFGAKNRFPAYDVRDESYEEGSTYPRAPLSSTYQLDRYERPGIDERTPMLAHMSSTTVAFVPETGFEGDWMLQLDVDLPNLSHEPSAQVTLVGLGGEVLERGFVPLAADGRGTFDADFSSTSVRRVELTLTNGDHLYDCNEGTQWSCQGLPGPSRAFTYRAETWQPAP